jgi:hypothetical protein
LARFRHSISEAYPVAVGEPREPPFFVVLGDFLNVLAPKTRVRAQLRGFLHTKAS